jgi:uncharacterized membrane protein
VILITKDDILSYCISFIISLGIVAIVVLLTYPGKYIQNKTKKGLD